MGKSRGAKRIIVGNAPTLNSPLARPVDLAASVEAAPKFDIWPVYEKIAA